MQEQFEDNSTMKTQVLPQGKLTELSARWNFCLTSMCLPRLYCALASGLLLLIQRKKKDETTPSSEDKLKYKMWITSNKNYNKSTEVPIFNL